MSLEFGGRVVRAVDTSLGIYTWVSFKVIGLNEITGKSIAREEQMAGKKSPRYLHTKELGSIWQKKLRKSSE